jgi:hypothetical protein
MPWSELELGKRSRSKFVMKKEKNVSMVKSKLGA